MSSSDQVYDDGGDFESSSSYQRLVTELFFVPLYLDRHFSLGYFTERDTNKIKDMFYLILNTIKPSGNIIQFGDSDGGRLFKLYNRPSLDQRYLTSLAYGLFDENYFSIKEIPYDILAFILFGENSFNNYLIKQRSINSLPSTQFKDSGIYTLRNSNIFLAVSCMPNGQDGLGIHTHNDKLSFELTYKDIDIVVDPGSSLYSLNYIERNRIRSTEYHNTVMEKNFEQNKPRNHPNRLKNESLVRVNEFTSIELDCQHDGFLKKGGSIHRRKFHLETNKLTIRDYLEKNHPSRSFLHFGEQITIKQNKGNFHILDNADELLLLEIEESDNVKIEKYDYSPGYGEKVLCNRIVIEFKNNLIMRFTGLN